MVLGTENPADMFTKHVDGTLEAEVDGTYRFRAQRWTSCANDPRDVYMASMDSFEAEGEQAEGDMLMHVPRDAPGSARSTLPSGRSRQSAASTHTTKQTPFSISYSS